VKFVGSEGVMTAAMSGLALFRQPRERSPAYTIGTFPKAVQEGFLAACHAQYPPRRPSADALRPAKEETNNPPPEHSAHRERHEKFYGANRAGKPCFEYAWFGFRAAGPALLANVGCLERCALAGMLLR
jgi:hypothetical protein